MGLHQRFPVYARPIQFFTGAFLFVFGLLKGLSWKWDWALQTGNIFVQIEIPAQLVNLADFHAFFLFLSLAGLVCVLFFGRSSRAAAERRFRAGGPGLWGARFRFYPLTFLFGLFLVYYGIIFLFHASLAADDTPDGLVVFVYLNYAGILHRGVVSLLALAVLFVGGALATIFTLVPGLGFVPRPQPAAAAAAPADTPKPAPHPRPVQSAPAPTRSAVGQRARTGPVRAPSRPRPEPLSGD